MSWCRGLSWEDSETGSDLTAGGWNHPKASYCVAGHWCRLLPGTTTGTLAVIWDTCTWPLRVTWGSSQHGSLREVELLMWQLRPLRKVSQLVMWNPHAAEAKLGHFCHFLLVISNLQTLLPCHHLQFTGSGVWFHLLMGEWHGLRWAWGGREGGVHLWNSRILAWLSLSRDALAVSGWALFSGCQM